MARLRERHTRATRRGCRSALDALPATTTMSDPPPPPPTQRKSRVLAALDNPAFFFSNPPIAPPLATPLPPVSSGSTQTPIKQRHGTPAPLNYATALGLAGIGSSQKKRKASGLENDFTGASSSSPRPTATSTGGGFEFGLNYDQEGPVHKIDRGGDDQALKYVSSPPLRWYLERSRFPHRAGWLSSSLKALTTLRTA